MYAVVRTGSKQYKVELGSELLVEKIDKDLGQSIELETLLLRSDDGLDLNAAPVSAKIIGHLKSKKVIVFKYKPKKRYKVMKGHRQELTRLVVEKIGDAVLETEKKESKAKKAAGTETKKAKPETKTAKPKAEKQAVAEEIAEEVAQAAKEAAKEEKAAKATSEKSGKPVSGKASGAGEPAKEMAKKTAKKPASKAGEDKTAEKKPRASKKKAEEVE